MSYAVLLDVTVHAGTRAEVLEFFVPALEATRARAGNEGVEVLLDDVDTDRFVVVEHWDAPASYDAYNAWRGTPEGRIAGFREALAQPPVTTRGALA